MTESCPTCDIQIGLRQILYGLPVGPPVESKYIRGGCLVPGHDPIWAGIESGWRGWSLNNDLGTKLSEWKCSRCEAVGKMLLVNLDEETNNRLRNFTFAANFAYVSSLPNAMCPDRD